MIDPRVTRLAKLLINHSTNLQKGEHILIEAFDIPESMIIACVQAAREVGGHPHVNIRNSRVLRALNENAQTDNLDVWAACDRFQMEKMDAYLGIRGNDNVSEMAGISEQQMQTVGRHYMKPVHMEQRVNHTRWCVLRWPNSSMAQLAQVSTHAFEDFYFDVCTLDYAKMAEAVKPLVAMMEKTDKVHLLGPGETDLHFSIKDIPVIPCTGDSNIPDGECFTAPVRDSVNGVVHYNTPTIYNGITFENVRLVFKDGKIVEATADQNGEKINGIFDTDEGARYVGEFAIGFHPHITKPMKDILFDEKIAGSFHFTPGRAYEDADNGNRSEIHWDLVCIQRPDYTGGEGGEIRFDGVTVRKDGLFVVDELKCLNPDALIG